MVTSIWQELSVCTCRGINAGDQSKERDLALAKLILKFCSDVWLKPEVFIYKTPGINAGQVKTGINNLGCTVAAILLLSKVLLNKLSIKMKKIKSVILFIICVYNTGYGHNPGLLSYTDSSRLKRSANTIVKSDEKKRQRILKNMEKAMGKLPQRSGLSSLDIRVTDSLKEDTYTRYTINFTVAENERLPAYLFIPLQKGTPEKLPAMLVLHETDPIGKRSVAGQGAIPDRAHAKELAQRGYVVIAPDYPGFGDLKDYDFDNDRYKSGTMKGVFNHMRCIDLLQARDDVDAERIGVIGHSLGGHNAMFVGCF